MGRRSPRRTTPSTSGTLTFPVGRRRRPITVPIAGDTLDENDETFSVTLSNPSGAQPGTPPGTGTIVDNDPSPTVSINDVTIAEGTGTVNAVLTVSLSTASGRSVTVNYATANGTAVAPGDYTTASGTVTFPAGTTTQTISVPIPVDTTDEPNETVLVNLSSPSGATIADGQGVATITDNDAPPTLSIADLSVTEGQQRHVERHLHGEPCRSQRLHRHGELCDGERHGDDDRPTTAPAPAR